ncbi:O-antigen ligase family protein [Stutzerimonas stutzeri]|uniref:O-antigen ligase family protein n=1 Tax=Stutzerimonas stutzeri TaxID=316 RepID=UPI0026598B7E|nr:O-antigen ligase family protein [Stutzerimonas stutzeri]MCF6781800.1 O-antigen ligase domain-containing protein [Stutzerimonas stutzeri]MCF6804469.1 O-antigen ligase domain-containing protein [Stutzerimonas stutzeri]
MSDSLRVSVYLRGLIALGLYLQLAGVCFISDGSRYATITNISLFATALVTLFLYRVPWRLSKRAVCALAALCVWVIVVAVFNKGSVGQPWRWIRLVLYVWLYIYAISLVMQDRQLWRGLLLAVVCTASIFAWLSLFQALYVEQRGFGFRSFRLDSWGGHNMADFRNPIVSALYFGVMAIIALYLFLYESGWRKWLSFQAFLAALLYCYFTYSRGVWGGVLAGALICLLFSLRFRNFLLLLVGSAPLMGGALLFLHKAGGIDASYRDEIFWQWWLKLDTFLVFGAGAGADPEICIKSLRRCFNQAHSLYLQFFYEYGLLGLFLLLSLIFVLLLNGWRYRFKREFAPLGLGLMAFVIVVSIANYYVIFLRPGVFWIIFWLPVAILICEDSFTSRAEASARK